MRSTSLATAPEAAGAPQGRPEGLIGVRSRGPSGRAPAQTALASGALGHRFSRRSDVSLLTSAPNPNRQLRRIGVAPWRLYAIWWMDALAFGVYVERIATFRKKRFTRALATAMRTRDSAATRPEPRADAACYRETVHLLAALSKRHRNALQAMVGRTTPPDIAQGVTATPVDQLGERVGRLEDVAVNALAHLARISDYAEALKAMQESGSVVWLWGTVLNRAAEATDAGRMSGER